MSFSELATKVSEELMKVLEDSELTVTLMDNIYKDTKKYLEKSGSIYSDDDDKFMKTYLETFRNVYENLKQNSYVGNKTLLTQLKNKKINPDNTLTYFKTHSKWKSYKEDLEILNKEKSSINPDMATTTQFRCSKCKKNTKCCYYSVQTRSSDEPMTNFITCMECNYNWRE